MVRSGDGLLERDVEMRAAAASLRDEQAVHRRRRGHLAAEKLRRMRRRSERRQVRRLDLEGRKAMGESGAVEGDQVVTAPVRSRTPQTKGRDRHHNQRRVLLECRVHAAEWSVDDDRIHRASKLLAAIAAELETTLARIEIQVKASRYVGAIGACLES